jgi:starch phosphorylase
LRLDGWQEDADEAFDASLTPLEEVLSPTGEPSLATVATGERSVHVGAWRMMVGRVPVYLLDTDLEHNDPMDRSLCHRLYTGEPGLRLRQEWILGVGGVRVLRALGHAPSVWHANEGHAAFMMLERLREFMVGGMGFDDAVRAVRAQGVFTTHTPVPAGHDAFSLEQLEACSGPIWNDMGVGRDAVLDLGRLPSGDHSRFHMTALAMRLSSQLVGVSRPHGEESRRMWGELWPGRDVSRVPIGHVTNGVHLTTWMSHHVTAALNAQFGVDWLSQAEEPSWWERIMNMDPAALWAAHCELKMALIRAIREGARRRWADEWKEALHLVGAGTLLDERALTIGFARRFTTYKRADLIFRDIDRLHRLLVNPWRPVQIVFAGKAHPADDLGKRVLQRVYTLSREARFEGRIAFLEDYEMHLAHRLVQGVDLWLNVPRPPLEACGTSGMKAALNGVPQLSTLDGWWIEGYDDGRNGWALPAPAPHANADAADAADAEHLYRLLEEAVVPLFYTRDARNIPLGWVDKMKHALRVAGAGFTAQRMVRQYVSEYYVPAARGQAPADPPSA